MSSADRLFVLIRPHAKKSLVIISVLTVLVIAHIFFEHSSKSVKAGSIPSPECDNMESRCVPNIVKIETDYNEATLYFENCGELCKEMIVAFGKDPLANTSEIKFESGDALPVGGLLSYTVGALDPSMNYFFKIRCKDKKKCLEYSRTQKVHTSQCHTSFKSNSDIATVLTCGAQSKESQILGVTSGSDKPGSTNLTLYSVLAIVLMLTGVGIYSFVRRRYAKHVFRKRARGGIYTGFPIASI